MKAFLGLGGDTLVRVPALTCVQMQCHEEVHSTHAQGWSSFSSERTWSLLYSPRCSFLHCMVSVTQSSLCQKLLCTFQIHFMVYNHGLCNYKVGSLAFCLLSHIFEYIMDNIILFKSAACIDMVQFYFYQLYLVLCIFLFPVFVWKVCFLKRSLVFLLLYSANTMLVGKLFFYYNFFWTGL